TRLCVCVCVCCVVVLCVCVVLVCVGVGVCVCLGGLWGTPAVQTGCPVDPSRPLQLWGSLCHWTLPRSLCTRLRVPVVDHRQRGRGECRVCHLQRLGQR